MDQDKYNGLFEIGNGNSEKLKHAFKQVSDIRKFEIELYWKRATYFWALIAVAFAGYFIVLSSAIENKYLLSFVVGCIGLVFTFAWHIANRGSKYWQENWENHLDLLEDAITGPLYKTLLERPNNASLLEKLVTSPLSLSVSKINQWVGVYVIFIWLSLIFYSCYKSFDLLISQWLLILVHIIVLIVTIVICVLMICQGKTHKGIHTPRMQIRETKIQG